jgi:hypothetical protein
MCESVSVAMSHLPQRGLSTEESVLQGTSLWLSPFFPCRFLVVHFSPTRTWEVKSHHQQRRLRVEGIHTTGCCSMPRRDRLRHCCHHLSAMQSSAWCLTPSLPWTRALFAVLGRYPPPPRKRRAGFWSGIGPYVEALAFSPHPHTLFLYNPF